MSNDIKYVHTNIVAEDWQKLSQFYIEVFNCKPVYPVRDLSGEWIDNLTTIKHVNLKGIHLKLPGESEATLEIFEYNKKSKNCDKRINQSGFAHIAFHVDSVETLLERVKKHGGGQLGELVKKSYEGIGDLTVVYATDPEGNFVEIQNWSK